MSGERTSVAVKKTNKENILIGLKAYNVAYNEQESTFKLDNGNKIHVAENGVLKGNPWGARKLGEHELDAPKNKKHSSDVSQETATIDEVQGRLNQAGVSEKIQNIVKDKGYNISKYDPINGQIKASFLGTPREVDIAIDRNGEMKSNLPGFQGNDCRHFMDSLNSALNFETVEEKMHVEDQQVMRTVI